MLSPLWTIFEEYSPIAAKAYLKLDPKLERIDHVAFRTFNRGPVRLIDLELALTAQGYLVSGSYHFPAKKVRAKSYSKPNGEIPRIFLSELLVEQLPIEAQTIVSQLIAGGVWDKQSSPWGSLHWPKPSLEEYNGLLKLGGDYAAWTSIHGLKPNHFAASVEDRVVTVAAQLEALNYTISDAGGRIKGGPEFKLEQGSTRAETRPTQLADALAAIPAGYCEFVVRWLDEKTGTLFDGFVEPSADKIFESTVAASRI